MHSRIFGIIKKERYQEIIEVEGEIRMPKEYFEEYLPSTMDYVIDSQDYNEDCEWLIYILKDENNNIIYNTEEHTITFLEGFKEKYFKKKWEKLKEITQNEESFEKFCKSTSMSYILQEIINDKYSFYQCDEEGYYQTFDDFIRDLEINKEYKIFGSLDYHF